MKQVANVVTLKSKKARNTALSLRDTGYRFNDRDPDLEFVCNAITASDKSPKELSAEVNLISHGSANVCTNTIANWLSGKTRKPQNFTLTWVMRALGYERSWTKTN